MSLAVDVYWSFRSPYSYLAVPRLRELSEAYDVEVRMRPVYPLAIRQPDFFERNHPLWLRYTMLDVLRVAQFEGIAFGPPRPDPIVQDRATRAIASEQPYIRRVTRLGQAAARRGAGLAFAHEAGRLIWGGQEGWHEGPHLAGALTRAGLDPAEVEAACASYTILSLERLRAERGPAQPLVLLLGVDAFLGLASWKRWEEILDITHLAVANRPGYPLDPARMPAPLAQQFAARQAGPEALAHAPGGRIVPFTMQPLAISATEIRHLRHTGHSLRYLLPVPVIDYISQHQLYL